jgi:hypothetical protein
MAEKARTFIANGYYGKFFVRNHGTGITIKEMRRMEALASHMDIVIKLSSDRNKNHINIKKTPQNGGIS